ncbi:hypothetical protein OPAG_07661 [Rhodococcus opacus PD630]|nr:hypothetical protein OPAG_07661 [Rhodococcus opacus PD630]
MPGRRTTALLLAAAVFGLADSSSPELRRVDRVLETAQMGRSCLTQQGNTATRVANGNWSTMTKFARGSGLVRSDIARRRYRNDPKTGCGTGFSWMFGA